MLGPDGPLAVLLTGLHREIGHCLVPLFQGPLYVMVPDPNCSILMLALRLGFCNGDLTSLQLDLALIKRD